MVSLARAFRAGGHAVAFATDPGFSQHVGRVGFDAFPAGLDMSDAWKRFFETRPDWRDVAPQDQLRHVHTGLFAGVQIDPMLADLGRIIPAGGPIC